MCFDCDGVDENIKKKEEERKLQYEKEQQEKEKKEQEKRQEFSDPRVKAIFNLATELTRLRGTKPVGVGNLCNKIFMNIQQRMNPHVQNVIVLLKFIMKLVN